MGQAQVAVQGEGILKSSSKELLDERVDAEALVSIGGTLMTVLLLLRKGEAEPRAEELTEWDLGILCFLLIG